MLFEGRWKISKRYEHNRKRLTSLGVFCGTYLKEIKKLIRKRKKNEVTKTYCIAEWPSLSCHLLVGHYGNSLCFPNFVRQVSVQRFFGLIGTDIAAFILRWNTHAEFRQWCFCNIGIKGALLKSLWKALCEQIRTELASCKDIFRGQIYLLILTT